MNKKILKLSEQDIHSLVENTVKAYLTENEVGEGIWGGMKNAGRSFVNNGFRGMQNAYTQGSWASSISNYYNTAKQGLVGMQKIMQRSGDENGANTLYQIISNLDAVVNSYQQIATNASNKSTTSQHNNWSTLQNNM